MLYHIFETASAANKINTYYKPHNRIDLQAAAYNIAL